MAGYDLKQGKKPFIPMTEESLIELIEKPYQNHITQLHINTPFFKPF